MKYRSPVMFLVDPTSVPVSILISKLYLILRWVVASVIGRNSGDLGTDKSYVPVMLFDPLCIDFPGHPFATTEDFKLTHAFPHHERASEMHKHSNSGNTWTLK